MKQAAVLVCDEVLFSLTAKMTLAGIYTGDIAVPSDGQVIPQLIFVFVIEGDLDDPIQGIILEVTLPKSEPRRLPMPIAMPPPTPGRTKWKLLLPLPVLQAELHFGKIEAKVIHDKGEIVATAPWLVQTTSLQKSR